MGCFGIDLEDDLIFDGVDRLHMYNVTLCLLDLLSLLLNFLLRFLSWLLVAKNADLVLGGDEGNECTYNMGYMKRQAIFSCLSCTPDGNAGVCTACSLSCHDGHEVFFSLFSLVV